MPGRLVTEPTLPPQPPHGATNGQADYYRRRIDELVDGRLIRIEDAVRSLDSRADTIDKRLNHIFGGLALIVVIANLLAPTIIEWVSGK